MTEITLGAVIVCAIASIGMFEANAIQFGMDQLLEAPSAQLSAFIHWYFWSTHFGQQVVFCTIISTGITLLPFSSAGDDDIEAQMILLAWAGVLLVLWLGCVVSSHYLFHRAKGHMYLAKVEINPFKQMKKVLVFAWKNKYPLNRSAFTYCE